MEGRLLVMELTHDPNWAFYEDLHYLPCKKLRLYANWRELRGNDATPKEECSLSTDAPQPNADSQPTPMTEESQDSLINHFKCCFRRLLDAGVRNGGSCNGTSSTQPVRRTRACVSRILKAPCSHSSWSNPHRAASRRPGERGRCPFRRCHCRCRAAEAP